MAQLALLLPSTLPPVPEEVVDERQILQQATSPNMPTTEVTDGNTTTTTETLPGDHNPSLKQSLTSTHDMSTTSLLEHHHQKWAANQRPPTPPHHVHGRDFKSVAASNQATQQRRQLATEDKRSQSIAVESLAPSKLQPQRQSKLRWKDQCGGLLVSSMPFFRYDEPWRCSTVLRGPPAPLANLATPPRRASWSDSAFNFLEAALPQTNEEVAERTAERGVQLRSVVCRAPKLFINVCVRNNSFQKEVFVRYTTDGWKSFNDMSADYNGPVCLKDTATIQPNDKDCDTDLFSVCLNLPNYGLMKTIDFCVCYRDGQGTEHWDSAPDGTNYRVEVSTPKSDRVPSPDLHNPYMSYGRPDGHGFCL